MNYYQFHIADFALHTSHLTLEEEAVFRRLLDYYYDTESPIPEETGSVIRRLRLGSYSETVASILEEFFVLQADGWHNLRADSEISLYNAKAERARENGKNGGRPKKTKELKGGKTKPVISGNPEESESKANHKPITNNQEPNTTTSSTHVDRCPTAEIIKLFSEHAPSLVQPRITPDAVKAQIAARWRESPEHQSLEFWREFFKYCEQSDFLAGRSDGRGAKPFRVGLEWVVKSSNFAKIINGNYHGESATA